MTNEAEKPVDREQEPDATTTQETADEQEETFGLDDIEAEDGDEEATDDSEETETEAEGDATDEGQESEEGTEEASEEDAEGQEGDEDDDEETDDGVLAPPATTTTEAPDILDKITEEAKARVIAKYGSFDELEPKHMVALTVEAQKLAKHHDAHTTAMREANNIFQANGGKKFQPKWQEYMGDMKARDRDAMLDAEAVGDYSLTLKHINACAARQKANKANADAKANGLKPTKKGNPPKTLPAGNGSEPAARGDKNVLGLDDLGFSSGEF